ncbi:MAG TPA: glycosyltransferase, partial [Vicinamibacteria bacterium]
MPVIGGKTGEKVRVLHVLPSGSGAAYFKGLARHFDRVRFAWDFLTLEGEERELEELGVETRGLAAGRGASGVLRAGFRLRRLLDREGYHIVHLHLFPSLVAGGLARLAGSKPLFVASHHYGRETFLYRGNFAAQWAERAFCRRMDHLIAVSRDIEDYLRDEIGIPPERMSLIHYGFDFDELPPGDRRVSSNGSFVVGSVARLHWTKGQEYLLRAVARLKHEDGVHTELLLLGTGPEESVLKARARELGIESEVSFLGHVSDPFAYY